MAQTRAIQIMGWERERMRRLAGLAIVLACGGTGSALAATPAAPPSPAAAALAEAAFLPSAASADIDAASLFGREQGLTQFNGAAGASLGHNDALRIDVGSFYAGPNSRPLLVGRPDVNDPSYEVRMSRDWPNAFKFGGHGLDFDVTPHAGVGMSSYGAGSAEAGATLHISKSDLAAARLKALGFKDGATRFGDRGRWYLFAAASGRAVGLNMMHGDTGWNRAGWTTDTTSRLVGDTQVGVGWRKGSMQTSVGFVHRDVKGDHLMYGVDPHSESMVAFSFAIRRH
jgi:hypothetical protein